MKDRKEFEVHTLPNGITVHSHKMDVPYFSIRAVLPIGVVHAHAGNIGGIPGIVHFLEHELFHRSERHPEKDSFEKERKVSYDFGNRSSGFFDLFDIGFAFDKILYFIGN